jgi:phage repressor protein C with HTH and peptisase S24 domain
MEDTQIKYFRAALKFAYEKSEFKNWKDVARQAGISQSIISEIRKKKSYTTSTQAKIARVFGYEWFDFIGLGKKILDSKSSFSLNDRQLVIQVRSENERTRLKKDADNYWGIPVYEYGRLAAGTNGLMIDPHEEPSSNIILSQKEMFGRKGHNLFGLKVGGASMEPLIPKGAVVVVDADDRGWAENKVFAVNFPENGQDIAAVKRVKKGDGVLVLLSENHQRFDPVFSRLDWPELCVGRVVWVGRKL